MTRDPRPASGLPDPRPASGLPDPRPASGLPDPRPASGLPAQSYSSGERVFGPPNGTFDPDWAATALRSNRPELDFVTSVRLVEQAWELLRTRDLRGSALADALDIEPGLAAAVAAVATETAQFYLDR